MEFEVLSKHSFECKKHQHEDKDSEEHQKWKENYLDKCQNNYERFSGGMEGAGDFKIFKRSIAC